MALRRSKAQRVRSVSLQAKAVMKAFRSAKRSAPKFMSACGIFPEVSELATDRLHTIVHELAVRQLNKGRHLRALQRRIQRLASKSKQKQSPAEIVDEIGTDLTAILASEAIAAYVFGLSVGMTVRTLPDR
ncbi:MAG TPA: hypothetical protein VM096_14500 [Vicinamibacterales bacterium]|nr:hypothetical protein [Vicinamibacterales bacterium]